MKKGVLKFLTPLAGTIMLMALQGQQKPQCVPVPPPEPGPECSTPKDCEGLLHPMCLGEWQCVEGKCSYQCIQPEEECYSDADCPEGQHCSVSDGECLPDPKCPMCTVCYGKCVSDKPKCQKSGCSGEVCSDKPVYTPCWYLPWFECLNLTECGPFAEDGGCGWKMTDDFVKCVEASPCEGNNTCPPGFACVDGHCSQGGKIPCATDDDCPEGQVCHLKPCPPCECPESEDGSGCVCACPVQGFCGPPECVPQTEVCDGVDNDCDGQVDEGEVCENKCKGDADCEPWEHCVFKAPDCPPGAFCVPPAYGHCELRDVYCLTDADCHKDEVCEMVDCDDGEDCGWPVGNCVKVEEPCTSDKDCYTPYEYCDFGDNVAFDELGCCPPGVVCIPEIPPCGKGVCRLKPGYCWDDSDCKPGEKCEGAIICPPGAMCIIADQPGKCVGGSECKSDDDCPVGYYCKQFLDPAGGLKGTCEEVPEGLCVRDKDCGPNGKCVFGPCPLCIPCPCFGKCEPQKECKVLKPGSHGQCEMVLGWIFDGETCVLESGCSKGADEPYFFDTLEECKEVCHLSECVSDEDCGPGYYCETKPVCPPCVHADPPCGAPCMLVGTCKPLSPGQCVKDADCPKGTHCEFGVCPMCIGCPCFGECVPDEPKKCETDLDCAPGYYCAEETVCPPCVDYDPPCEHPCFLEHVCKPLPEGSCMKDADCGDNMYCKQVQCVKAPCFGICTPKETKKCNSDEDCGPGQYCDFTAGDGMTGICKDIPKGNCLDSADCPEGLVCEFTEPCPLCPLCPCFGTCQPPEVTYCNDDKDCPKGQKCFKGGPVICIDCFDPNNPGCGCFDGICAFFCYTDSDCPKEYACDCGPVEEHSGPCQCIPNF